MIREAFGLIYAGEQIINLRELVEARAVGALPIGGRYRVIDFALSNMVNSGIRTVGVVASRNYNSLMDHLATGKSWDLSRKSDGLFLLTPYANRDNQGIYTGMIDALKNSMDFLRRAKHQYCVLTGSHTVFNRTYDDMMRFHIDSGADITILYNRAGMLQNSDRYEDVRLRVDKHGVVQGMEINPGISSLDCTSMGVYIIRKDILIYLVEECYAKGEHHFADNLLRANLDRLKVTAFEHSGYVGRMHSVAAYFKANMDLLDAGLQQQLFRGRNRIYTKVKDEVPAKYIGDAKARNCIVANGCIIEGEVENSVLFRGVYVGKGTRVKDCIILPNVEINDDAELENVVLDKDVSVRNRSRLIGNPEFPVIIRKGAMV